MAKTAAITLDARTMVPSERHSVIFDRLNALQVGEALRLVNDHDPKPLKQQLMAEYPDMFAWKPEQEGPEEWIIRIVKVAEAE